MLVAVEGAAQNKGTSTCLQGTKALQEQQYEQAVQLLDNCLLKEKPDGKLRTYSLLNRATARLNLKKIDAAIADYNAALRDNPMDPKFATAYVDRAFAYWTTGKPDRALADLETAKKLGLNGPKERYLRGSALLGVGKAKESLSELDAAIAGGRKDAATLVMRSGALFEVGKHKEAIQQLDIVLKEQPDLVIALINRSTINEKQGKFDQALVDIDRANVLVPNNPTILNNRCFILARMKRGAEGLIDCEKAVAILGEKATAGVLHSLAVAQAETGKRIEAQATFKKALAMTEKGSETRAIIEADMKKYSR